MVNARHGKQTIDQGIHGAIAFQYANAAARAAGGPFESSDINKLAYQVDTGEIYVLTNPAGPTWSIFTTLDGVVSHATSHESGGADEVTVDNLITLEMNASYALKPDGAGGVHWGLAGGGGSGSGSVTGPVSTTDNALVRWDGTDGYFIQDSGIIVDNSDNITGAGTINGVTITAHSSRHEDGGADAIDGYQLGVVYIPSNYSAPTSDVLGLHLYEIDQALASSGVTDHGLLTGLADDDHTQYLLVNGTRAMSGALNMGTNNITNIGTVDGVDVSSHASRHEDGGADAVDGYQIGLIYVPSNYSAPASDILGLHLYEIDQALASTGVTDHGLLTGLADDDHTQYLLVSGVRAMSGALDMGTNNITNVGTVDSVDISAHASRHEDGGADAVDGYQLGVVYVPSNYSAPASDILGLHLYEIDQELSTIITDHGLLTGLNDDDHTQYLLVSGVRAMSGALDMGTNNITNVGTVDGVTVSGHSSRHESGGADAIDGYQIGLIYVPSNYSAPASDILGLHLYEIDLALAGIVTDHGGLTGLSDDDHTQYLLVNGTRAMSGSLNMGTGNITNVGTVDGVTVSAHSSRHETGGADAIDGYQLGVVYAPSNYSAPASDILGLHIYEIDQELSTIVTDHGGLTGLADDDHTQYLLVNGTRAMSGALDMGTNSITNVGTVDGVTVSSHASRHENGGADEVEVSNLGTSELNTAYVLKPDGAGGVHWVVSTGGGGSGSGSVTGPVTTTDNALVRWDGTDGYFIQDSGIIVDNSDNITGAGTINGVTITAHASRHESGGADAIDGYQLVVIYAPSNYSAPASDILGLHLYEIDQALASSGVTDHGLLTGLSDDDHTQYLLVNGTRAMTGALDMGTNNITNVGTVDGVDVSGHASRHEDGGADAIDGYQVSLVYSPSNYGIPTSDILGLHLYEIDLALAGIVTDHGGLTGLSDDDHTQYLLVNGTRAMSGSFNMGTNNITNVGTVDGVTVSSHASRHEDGGADAIDGYQLGVVYAPSNYGIPTSDILGLHLYEIDQELSTIITDHGLLTGLNNDDHTQYLLVNGVRAMSGALDMGTNNITNVGTVDGIDVSAHASRHEDGGGDVIDGYQVAITYVPSNYTTPASDILGLHLYEIDQELSTIVTDHGGLAGLVDDDHTQYLLVNGTRAMTGALDMGTNNITNVGTVDGVDVSSHASRHESGGADAIDGYQLGVIYAPSNYSVPASDILGLHLYEIDQALASTGVTDHGLLTGLADDDHTQYLLVSGVRAMSGALDMGTNNITNVGTVDGVTVSSHSSRHEDGGADAIDGYQLGVVYIPSNYSAPTSDILGLHLYEIDQALASTGVTDHGLLTGLADDDHTQYLLVNGTRAMTGALDLDDHDLSNARDGYFGRNLEVGNKLTVGGLIDPTGLVLEVQASVPGGTPAAGSATLWVRNTDGYAILTDELGTDVVLSSGGGGGGSFSGDMSGGDIINIGTATFDSWPTVVSDGTDTIDFASYQQNTLDLNDQATTTVTINVPLGPGNFTLLLKQGSSTPTTAITWATEGTHALYAPYGAVAFAQSLNSITLIGLVYDGTDWYVVSTQPMQQVIAS